MTPQLLLYIICFALTFGALATLPFFRRRRAGASLRLSLEPMMVICTLIFMPPALMSMGGGVSYGMVAPGMFALLFGVTQWVLLSQGGSALARRVRLPGWCGAALLMSVLIALSIGSEAGYLFASTWLLPPLTVALSVWRTLTRPDPQLAPSA